MMPIIKVNLSVYLQLFSCNLFRCTSFNIFVFGNCGTRSRLNRDYYIYLVKFLLSRFVLWHIRIRCYYKHLKKEKEKSPIDLIDHDITTYRYRYGVPCSIVDLRFTSFICRLRGGPPTISNRV